MHGSIGTQIRLHGSMGPWIPGGMVRPHVAGHRHSVLKSSTLSTTCRTRGISRVLKALNIRDVQVPHLFSSEHPKMGHAAVKYLTHNYNIRRIYGNMHLRGKSGPVLYYNDKDYMNQDTRSAFKVDRAFWSLVRIVGL